MVLGGVNVLLIILSVLQLCVSISCAHMSGSMARGWCPRAPPGWCQALLDALLRSLKRLCCTVSPLLLFSSPAVLGTIQILVGLVTVGLGPGRTSTSPGDLTQLGAPYWLGAVLGVTVFMNISGAILAITGIVLYAIDLSHSSLSWMCPSPSHREQSSGLLSMMDILLIVLTLLQLCVSISTTILGIQALTRPRDYDQCRPNAEKKLLESVAAKYSTI
ncbi:hypothetical protein CRUP_019607 [Coryphaenoides rupestris]|nr:hypothetical protein CRUP_019607 [Coryphaenoides rupestris]